MANSKFLNDYFTLGSDLKVRRFGFGAMRITGDGIWGEPKNHQEAVAVVKKAVELGINFIDTADAYGPNVSEEIIAEALYPYSDDVIIATKGGLVRPGPNRWDSNGRPEHLKAALEGSLKRLKRDQIDVYQFHRPDPKVPFEESLGTLIELKNQGKIRHIGLSNVTEDQLKKALEMVEIVTIQNRYNLTDRSSESLVDVTDKHNVGFIPWNPLAVGDLENNDKVQEIAKSHDATPSQIALAWLLKRSPNMLPIAGTGSVDHLEENLKGTEIELSDDEFQTLATLKA